VTGFVGAALASAGVPVDRAATWCLDALGRRGGWGFNASVPPDADSTAWVCMLLAAAGRTVPASALDLLERHRVPGAGARTYRRTGSWGEPLPDVAAAALRARHAAGRLSTVDLATEWVEDLGSLPEICPAFWWSSPIYPTAIVRDVWALAGRPGRPPPAVVPAPATAFELAWCVILALALGARPPLDALLAAQQPDGGWPTGPFLVVPSPAGGRSVTAGDDRRLLTTASAVLALGKLTRPGPPARRTRPGGSGRSAAGLAADAALRSAAAAVGVDGDGAVGMFQELTRETFCALTTWPSSQLSSLSTGVPLELSVVAGPDAESALRYACEVGNPLLPAGARAASAVAAVRRSAVSLGLGEAWDRISPAVAVTTDPALPVPDSCRFRVWGGLDQSAGGPPALKVYLSLLHAELGEARRLLDAVLERAGVPVPAEVAAMLDLLDTAGFVHEVGFGLGPGGRIAVKVYHELEGWRPALVRDLLGLAGLPSAPELLVPELPGVLRESLAARSRAGIALRLDPADGSVRELTTAAAFPPPLVGNAETRRRVRAWIDANGWRSDYAAVSGLLAVPSTSVPADLAAPLHSLFTRTVGRDSAWTTVYLRPPLLRTSQPSPNDTCGGGGYAGPVDPDDCFAEASLDGADRDAIVTRS
jgi:hypothetical protein